MMSQLSLFGFMQGALIALVFIGCVKKWTAVKQLNIALVVCISFSLLRPFIVQSGYLSDPVVLLSISLFFSFCLIPVSHLLLKSILNSQRRISRADHRHFIAPLIFSILSLLALNKIQFNGLLLSQIGDLSIKEIADLQGSIFPVFPVFVLLQAMTYYYLNRRSLAFAKLENNVNQNSTIYNWAKGIHLASLLGSLIVAASIWASSFLYTVPVKFAGNASTIVYFIMLGIIISSGIFYLRRNSLILNGSNHQLFVGDIEAGSENSNVSIIEPDTYIHKTRTSPSEACLNNSLIEDLVESTHSGLKTPLPNLELDDFSIQTKSSTKHKYSKSGLSQERMKILNDRAMTALIDDELYQNSDLNMPALADHINCSVNHLSQTLNTIQSKSFNEILNDYRLIEVKTNLEIKPNKAVIEVAMDAGFNSKSSFYSLFKKHTGMTPGNYRKMTVSSAL